MGHDALIEHVVGRFGPQSVEQLIQNKDSREAFEAERKKVYVNGAAFRGYVDRASEKVLHLPGNKTVVIRTDESGVTTHVEEDECQHAIVRPATYRPFARMR